MKDLVSEGFANVVKPYIDNEIATRAELGAHNILKFPNELSDNGYEYSGDTGKVTAYGECGFKINGTFPSSIAVYITPRETTDAKYLFYLKKGSYRVKLFDSNFINQTFGDLTVGARAYTTYNGASNRIASSDASAKTLEFTIDENTQCDYITSDGRYLIGIALMPSVTTFNNLVVYPLLELASDNNTSYQPYAKTNKELTAENQTLTNKLNGEIETRARVSAHNFLVFDKSKVIEGNTSGNWASNVYTINGGTITLSDKGEIVVNGTFTAQTDFAYTKRTTSDLILTPGDYKLVGGISDNISVNGNCTRNGAYNNLGTDTGDDLPFTITSDDAGVGIFVRVLAGTYDNVKVSPMITAPHDFASGFTPYAMTNRELTEAVTPVKGSFTYLGATWYYKIFKDYIVIGSEDAVSARMDASSWATMATITELAGAFQYALNGMLFPNNGDVLKLNLQTTGELRYYRIVEGDRAGLYIQDNATLYDVRG